jgi:hypothetical protein
MVSCDNVMMLLLLLSLLTLYYCVQTYMIWNNKEAILSHFLKGQPFSWLGGLPMRLPAARLRR